MRRKEFEINDKKEIAEFLSTIPTGILSFCDDNRVPYGLPMSFAYNEDKILMHSGPQGEKIKNLNEGKKVMFTVFEDYSYIPPYFTGKSAACQASQFYKSVMIFGSIEIMVDNQKKIIALERLMKKFQPDGLYDTLNNNELEKMIDATVVFAVNAERITAKFKFGQNLNDDIYGMIIENLLKRNNPLDFKTAEMMKKYRKKT